MHNHKRPFYRRRRRRHRRRRRQKSGDVDALVSFERTSLFLVETETL